jgi:hypothetical protein
LTLPIVHLCQDAQETQTTKGNGGSVGRIPRITAKGKIIFQPAPSLRVSPTL